MARLLGDWLESYLEYTYNSEPATNFRLWTGISVIAAALKRKCCLPWGYFNLYPNLYIVLVGPSGSRKGTAMGPGQAMLRRLGVKVASEAITREALIRELKNSSDTQANSDGSRLAMHSSLTIFSKEMTVFLGYNNQQLMADLCDWFDCDERWTYRTKNMGTDEIIGVWVNLIGATTPDLLQTTLPRDAIGGGLTARMIMIYEPRKGKTVVFPIPSEEDKLIGEKLVADLEQISMLSGEFKVTEEFLEEWARWYLQQEASPPFDDQRFGGYIERRATHTLKLSMIVSASESDDLRITKAHLHRAIRLLEGAEQKMLRAFSGVGKARLSDITTRVMQYLGGVGEVDLETLLRKFYYDADKQDMDRILGTLDTMHIIRIGYLKDRTIIKYIGKEDFYGPQRVAGDVEQGGSGRSGEENP